LIIFAKVFSKPNVLVLKRYHFCLWIIKRNECAHMLDKSVYLCSSLENSKFSKFQYWYEEQKVNACVVSVQRGRIFLEYFIPGFRVPQERYNKEYVLRFFKCLSDMIQQEK